MVGTMQQGTTMFALVRTPEKDVFQVRPGNHLGQDYGVVTAITDSEIKLKELVQDSAGDWSERISALQLMQAEPKSGGK
jgi:type IV pilus assembly protein PilP